VERALFLIAVISASLPLLFFLSLFLAFQMSAFLFHASKLTMSGPTISYSRGAMTEPSLRTHHGPSLFRSSASGLGFSLELFLRRDVISLFLYESCFPLTNKAGFIFFPSMRASV